MTTESHADLEAALQGLLGKVEEYERWFRFLDAQNRALGTDQARLKAILEHGDLAFAVFDSSLTLLWANDRMQALCAERPPGLEHESAAAEPAVTSCWSLLCGEEKACEGCPVKAPFASGAAAHRELTLATRSGPRAVRASALPIGSPFGTTAEVLLMMQDLTGPDELARAREQLRRSEERYRATFDAASVGMVVLSAEGRFLDANQPFCSFIGYTLDDLRQLGFPDVTHPDDLEDTARTIEKALAEGGTSFELDKRCRRKDGSFAWAHVTATWRAEAEGGAPRLVAFVTDITRRKAVETALRESEARKNAIFEATLDPIVTIDDRGWILEFNTAAERTFGHPREEVIGCDLLDLLTAGGDLGAFPWPRSARSVPPVGQRFQMTAAHADGTTVPIEISLSRMPGEDGPPLYTVFIRDLTMQRMAEAAVREREEQVRHAQKMDAIGALAGGVAHDFNNLLTGILGQAEMLRLGPVSAERISESIEIIERAAQRAARLTQQLLGFARRGKHQDIPVDLHAAAGEVIALLRRTMEKTIAISEEFRAPNPWVQGDPEQIQQVILNLAINARDAMPTGGELTVGTIALGGGPGRSDATHIELFMRDTGSGIAPEHRDRVFDPFFTTKEQGKGTGMGLPMVYGIVKNHGGSVRFDTEVGRGTTFRVSLPLTTPPAATLRSEPVPSAVRGVGRILVVDDEEVVREVASQYLRLLGYEVETARDGVEASALYRSRWREIDLVLIDMMMPRMGGGDCFRTLREINPDVRAVLTTGFGMNTAAQETLDDGMAGFIQKPYTLQQLSEVVAKALSRSRAA